jgi:hypothetical protein
MKVFLFIVALVVISFSGSAQSTKIDGRLLSKYNIESLKTLQAENPKELAFLNYCVENAFYISALPEKKIAANPSQFKEIELSGQPILNFFDLNIDLLENEHQSFVIKGTQKLLIVKSKAHIIQELNK